MKKTLILFTLLTFFVSCAQLREMSDEKTTYNSEKQRVLTEKANDRDINLPTGSTVLEDDAGFTILGALGLDSDPEHKFEKLTFQVALDQVSFMPLLSVDSTSGVIITDWYSLDNGKSRLKINILITDQEMADSSLEVTLFTQSLDGERWVDEGINREQSLKIKKSILSSARSLKVASEL